jgi:hypothetical protein
LQLVAHVLDLGPDIFHEVPSSLHLVDLEPEAVGVMFDGFDALDEVLEILGEVLERLFELAPGLSQFGAVCRGSRGSYSQV